MSIYTKKGDKGMTSLYTEKPNLKCRVPKDVLKINVLGSIDELNSLLGLAISFSNFPEVSVNLKEIQRNLFRIGSIIAGAKIKFSSSEVKKMENRIDSIEAGLTRISNFILPGGSIFSSYLHFSRSIARRAEREVVSLYRKEKFNPQILVYMNRLSDYLFVLARYVNHKIGIKEETWSSLDTKKL